MFSAEEISTRFSIRNLVVTGKKMIAFGSIESKGMQVDGNGDGDGDKSFL